MKEVPWGDIPASIENALREYGPMTAAELCLYVPGLPNDIRKACARMATPSKRRVPVGKRRIHVTDWVYDVEGARKYPRPLYKLGHGSNKTKPARPPRNEVVKTWQRKVRKHQTHNFVFNLGLPA